MPAIQNEGDFAVKIVEAKMKATPKENDQAAFAIDMFGETEDGLTAVNTLYFSHKIIGGGRYAGRSNFEMSCESLKQLGVSLGSPRHLDTAIAKGLHAVFVMKYDEYNGETRLKCKYMNAPDSRLAVGEVNWDKVLDQFDAIEGDVPSPPSQQAEPEKQTITQAANDQALPDGEIPF